MNLKQAEILRDLVDLLEREGCEGSIIDNLEDGEEGLAFTLTVYIPRGKQE